MTINITRDEIMSLDRNAYGYLVCLGTDYPGQGPFAEILHNDHGTGYAITMRTRALLHFRPLTGKARKDGMAAVVVTFAEDTGDMAGTLSFDEAAGTHRATINNALLD